MPVVVRLEHIFGGSHETSQIEKYLFELEAVRNATYSLPTLVLCSGGCQARDTAVLFTDWAYLTVGGVE